ncbi:MAG TPA: hypothetical protein VGQ46_20940 [Thermoanaerobaculia bacterium]|jgi:hypothetical protein|nr:hypothetical protein [Thermoanaerobaculia bacterium]
MTANPYPEERKWYESPKSVKRALGDDPAPAPSHTRRNVPANYRDVTGWGVDLNTRPMFPRELPSDVTTVRGDVRDWQTPTMKVHMSVEQPNLTPVFGTSCPPKGLSGLLRDYAYQFGEGANRHWMTLVLADRVDMIESMVADLFRGRGDNYIAEKAWSAKWKYADTAQRRRYATMAAAAVGGIAVAMVLRKVMRD